MPLPGTSRTVLRWAYLPYPLSSEGGQDTSRLRQGYGAQGSCPTVRRTGTAAFPYPSQSPGLFSVRWPSSMVGTPLQMTWTMPTGGWMGWS